MNIYAMFVNYYSNFLPDPLVQRVQGKRQGSVGYTIMLLFAVSLATSCGSDQLS